MTPDRKEFTGELCVYRESSLRGSLSATVRISETEKLYYYKVPKCFFDVIADGSKNKAKVHFTAALDGTRPRNVELIGEPY